jgi:hypothetical protein
MGGTMGHIAMEGAMGEGASFGSGSNRMIDGYYKRSRRSYESGRKGWTKEKFKGAMDQGASIESELNRRSDYYVL